jgi:DNA-binding protein YbaB
VSSGYQEQLGQLMAQLDGKRKELLTAREDMAQQTAKVTSKDRMVTVVVGAQSELRELKFHTEQYRSMAPAELSKVLVEVIETARTQVRDKLLQNAAPLMAVGEQLRDSLIGGSPLHSLIGDVGRMWPETAPGAALRPSAPQRPADPAGLEDEESDG